MATDSLRRPGIYVIRSKRCGRVYVGSTVNLVIRWNAHRRELNLGIHRTHKLQEAWRDLGEDNFSFVVLELADDRSTLLDREQHWLDTLDAVDKGFNTLYLVERPPPWTPERRALLSAKVLGHPVTEATRHKLRLANLGKKTHSDASRAILRARNTGKKMSPEAIAQTAAFWRQHKHTAESRAKMSFAALAREERKRARCAEAMTERA